MKKLFRLSVRLLWWQMLFASPVMLLRFALGEAGLTRVPAGADDIRVALIADGFELKSEATAFRGGAITCMMGGAMIDFRGAVLAEGGADVRLVTLMGGAVFIIPPEWAVEYEGRSIMGGAEVAPAAESSGPALRIHALTVMGGFNVIRRPIKGSEAESASSGEEPDA